MPADAYFKDKDGVYVAAEDSDIIPFSWIRILIKVLLQVTWNLPGFVEDIIREYRPKKTIRRRIALVTGGGNGFGRALCLRLAREGCRVAVVDINEESAKETVSIIHRLGKDAKAYRADVSDYVQVQMLRTSVEGTLGKVDILVNNAGLLATANCQISDGSDEDLRRIIDVNLSSHYWMIREFKPTMMGRNSGHIVAISSIFGLCATSRTNVYGATKSGVRAMMDSLNAELYFSRRDEKIFTTCVYPCLMATRKDLMEHIKDVGFQTEIMHPDQAADIVVEGILQNKKEIILGSFMLRLMVKLHAFLPFRLRHIITDCMVTKPSRPAHGKTA